MSNLICVNRLFYFDKKHKVLKSERMYFNSDYIVCICPYFHSENDNDLEKKCNTELHVHGSGVGGVYCVIDSISEILAQINK